MIRETPIAAHFIRGNIRDIRAGNVSAIPAYFSKGKEQMTRSTHIVRTWRELGTFTFAAIVMIAAATQSQAAQIASSNYDAVQASQGNLTFSGGTSNFVSPSTPDIGDLTVNVYFNSGTGIYTYVLDTTPQNINNVTNFNTGFNAQLNGLAGYSYSDVTTLGGGEDPGNVFSIDHDSEGRLDWRTLSDFWDSGEQITFFFQSDKPAANARDTYGIINSKAGEAINLRPIQREGEPQAPVIPAPAALPAGIALLSACGLWGRIRRS